MGRVCLKTKIFMKGVIFSITPFIKIFQKVGFETNGAPYVHTFCQSEVSREVVLM